MFLQKQDLQFPGSEGIAINISYYLKTIKDVAINTYYVRRYYKAEINSRIILFESRHGNDLAGNILALMKELDKSYRGRYDVYLSCVPGKREDISRRLRKIGIGGVKLVDPRTAAYFDLLARAKYLFNDTSFTLRYIKKKGQVVVNTWHGTPLKVMGKDFVADKYSMGNIQRNLLLSDYLIYPNEFMKEKMISAFMLDGIYKGTVLNEGYPRNSVFFDEKKGAKLKERLGYKGKRVFVYMPTWRGEIDSIDTGSQAKTVRKYLKQLDKLMNYGQVLIVKLHPFAGDKLDFGAFRHIVPMNAELDAYEVLNAADGLVTDYSSVFFDYAVTGRKIILFPYDEQEYMAQRGTYMTLDSLPFPKVYDVKSLYREMCAPKDYDDTEFRKRFCTYESPDAAGNILKRVLEGKRVCSEEKIFDNSKENVLVFAGNLARNGITTAAVNLFDNIDTDKRRYFVTFQQTELGGEHDRVSVIPEGVNIMPMSTKPQYTLLEAAAMIAYYKLDISPALKIIEKMCEREAKKFFGGADIDRVIQYEGYGKNMIHLFRMFDCERYIFVHNDMVRELKEKDIQHGRSLKKAYNDYDRVVCVTGDMVRSVYKISGRRDNIRVVNNCHSYLSVLEKAEKPVGFDADTKASVSCEELCEILDGSSIKLINIGRFSREKGHDMLIEAFERFSKKYPDSRLIIIGGYGKLYEQTCEMAEASSAAEKITVIRSMSNPMPVLKRCDLFVLSSRYEGLGLTVLEADTLGIPVVSTKVPGPYGFMKKHEGYMVKPDADSLYEGMEAFVQGRVKPMNVDYKKYNENAVKQFEALFASGKK